jgi:hypothetical protein
MADDRYLEDIGIRAYERSKKSGRDGKSNVDIARVRKWLEQQGLKRRLRQAELRDERDQPFVDAMAQDAGASPDVIEPTEMPPPLQFERKEDIKKWVIKDHPGKIGKKDDDEDPDKWTPPPPPPKEEDRVQDQSQPWFAPVDSNRKATAGVDVGGKVSNIGRGLASAGASLARTKFDSSMFDAGDKQRSEDKRIVADLQKAGMKSEADPLDMKRLELDEKRLAETARHNQKGETNNSDKLDFDKKYKDTLSKLRERAVANGELRTVAMIDNLGKDNERADKVVALKEDDKQEKRGRELYKYLDKLGKDIPKATFQQIAGLERIEDALEQNTGNIQGIGPIEGGFERWMTGDKARALRQEAEQLYAPYRKEYAGVALNKIEQENVNSALGKFRFGASEQEFKDGVRLLRESLASALKRSMGSKSDEVNQVFHENTGIYIPGDEKYGKDGTLWKRGNGQKPEQQSPATPRPAAVTPPGAQTKTKRPLPPGFEKLSPEEQAEMVALMEEGIE